MFIYLFSSRCVASTKWPVSIWCLWVVVVSAVGWIVYEAPEVSTKSTLTVSQHSFPALSSDGLGELWTVAFSRFYKSWCFLMFWCANKTTCSFSFDTECDPRVNCRAYRTCRVTVVTAVAPFQVTSIGMYTSCVHLEVSAMYLWPHCIYTDLCAAPSPIPPLCTCCVGDTLKNEREDTWTPSIWSCHSCAAFVTFFVRGSI